MRFDRVCCVIIVRVKYDLGSMQTSGFLPCVVCISFSFQLIRKRKDSSCTWPYVYVIGVNCKLLKAKSHKLMSVLNESSIET